jgi:hypothetical protein
MEQSVWSDIYVCKDFKMNCVRFEIKTLLLEMNYKGPVWWLTVYNEIEETVRIRIYEAIKDPVLNRVYRTEGITRRHN